MTEKEPAARSGQRTIQGWRPGFLFPLQSIVNPGPSVPGPEEGIMDIERILDAYRNGDEDKQLDLFLGFHELRAEFSRIEQDIEAARSLTRRGPKWPKWITGWP
jgi:hypothetical protein